MALIRRSYLSPFAELGALRDEMNRLFDARYDHERAEENLTVDWRPVVDIFEDNEVVRLVAELPGVSKDDLKIHVENGTLTLSGERKAPDKQELDKYVRVERLYGRFSRSFSLTNQIDQEKIEADYTNGLLSVTLHKREETKPKQIAVKVS